jgi:hypothetical protein
MMTARQARKWLILSSLIITGVQIVFLFIAPSFDFPLVYPRNLDLLQIVTPVFLGYLGSAAHFVTLPRAPEVPVHGEYLGLMVKGPIIIYAAAVVAAFTAFGYSNRVGVPIGNGMTVENLATALSISLGVLAATTGILIPHLFVGIDQTPSGDRDEQHR